MRFEDVRMKYVIIRIDEPDFGCEGLPDGMILMDDVLLRDENRNEKMVQIPDAQLYERNWNEGDIIEL